MNEHHEPADTTGLTQPNRETARSLCQAGRCPPCPFEIELEDEQRAARVTAVAAARWTTGVEMEALVAVSAACLTLYDMAKAVDRGITITEVQLQSKRGGKSDAWRRRSTRSRRAAH